MGGCQTLPHHFFCSYHHHPTHSLLPPPSPSWPPTWAKQGHAHRWCLHTTFRPCHYVPPPLHQHPVTAHHPPLIEGCGRTGSAMSHSTNDDNHMSHHCQWQPIALCHITVNNNQPPVPRHLTKTPTVECHVTRMKEARRIETGVERRRTRGKDEKRETAGGEKGICAPSLL